MPYGAEYQGVYISVNRERRGSIRSPQTGRYIQRNAKELLDANKRSALALQADVVENVLGSIQRRAVSSGRLARVTGDRRNVFWTESGFGVGIEDYLDKSEAKYWRQIEEGTDVHVGREIRGVFGGTLAGPRRGGSPLTSFGQDYGGKFIPISKSVRTVFDGGRPVSVRKSTIGQPIEAHDSYADAFYADGGMAERSINAAVDYIAKAIRDSLRGFE